MTSASNPVEVGLASAGEISAPPPQTLSAAPATAASTSPRLVKLLQYVAIARPHHYGKNALVVVGSVLAYIHHTESLTIHSLRTLAWGLCATCLIASSNYVLNEILDAGYDRHHVSKRHRPLAAGLISPQLALLEWFVLGALGQWIASSIGPTFSAVAATFQLMSIAYNVRPMRLKDVPYLDVLSEAANSPLRLLLGWTIVLPTELPGLALILAFWMAGGFEMARKRLKEYRFLQDRTVAAAYRKSFSHYDEARLRSSMVAYAFATMFFSLIEIRKLWPFLTF